MSVYRPTRREHAPIKVYCLPEERQVIEAIAAAAGLSLSAYLLTLGQGYTVASRVDRDQVRELARINGDLDRLGGLLKLWLSNAPGAAMWGTEEIRALLHKIEERQEQMGVLMTGVMRGEQADGV